MKVLDLFAGLEGWSAPFRERGHEVCSVDIEERFQVDLHADILELQPEDLPWRPDLILASPPCESFTVMTMGRNWGGKQLNLPPVEWVLPKTPEAELGLRLVESTLDLIAVLDPGAWVIENPLAKLRKLPVMDGLERQTVSYCRFGEPFQKPTDLWGGFPPSLSLPPFCSGDPERFGTEEDSAGIVWTRDARGRRCHVYAGRGSSTGIQGDLAALAGGSRERRDLSALRAKVPYKLALQVCEAAELDLAEGRRHLGRATLF